MFPVIWSLCVVTSVGSPGHLIWPRVIFFLWGYLKAKVYARRPGTIEKSKEAIREEVAAIPPAMTRKAMDNFRERLQECVINNGSHFSYVILKVFEKMASYVLCKNKIIFCSFIISFGFYFPFKMCELYLPHPVYYSLNNITMTANMFSALQKPCWYTKMTDKEKRDTVKQQNHWLT